MFMAELDVIIFAKKNATQVFVGLNIDDAATIIVEPTDGPSVGTSKVLVGEPIACKFELGR